MKLKSIRKFNRTYFLKLTKELKTKKNKLVCLMLHRFKIYLIVNKLKALMKFKLVHSKSLEELVC